MNTQTLIDTAKAVVSDDKGLLAVAFGAMMLCHMIHFGMHKHVNKGEHDRPFV